MTLSSCGCKVPWALRGRTPPLRSGVQRRWRNPTPFFGLHCPYKPQKRHGQGENRIFLSACPLCICGCAAETGDTLGFRDGCDDCDGIFDTAPAVILIVTTVTNRHTASLAKLMELPLRVRFMAYSMLYSSRNFPAFTLSLRVRMFGCISS